MRECGIVEHEKCSRNEIKVSLTILELIPPLPSISASSSRQRFTTEALKELASAIPLTRSKSRPPRASRRALLVASAMIPVMNDEQVINNARSLPAQSLGVVHQVRRSHSNSVLYARPTVNPLIFTDNADIHSIMLNLMEFSSYEEGGKSLLRLILTETLDKLDLGVTQWLDGVFSPGSWNLPKNGKPPAARETLDLPSLNAFGRRASNFKKAQDLYQKDRVAFTLMENPLDVKKEYPTVTYATEVYGGIYASTSPLNEADVTPPPEDIKRDILTAAISFVKIENSLKSWRNSAPGPYGITVAAVKGCKRERLLLFYNIILLLKIVNCLYLACFITF
ncbi:hypothetical protein FQA39_LY05044 [Lamprigera yunnana]|nr:hypothetical protein FQA39_LY05044 [Lamprigera yunnana]